MTKKKKKKVKQVFNPDAAGIDIGSRSHYVCIPEGRDQNHIRQFGNFTQDLQLMAKWLIKCKIKTVAL